VNQRAYEQARQAFLETGDIDPSLLALLRRVVARLVRFGGLPPIYSPTGQWDAEAEADVLGDWITYRLLGSNQLAAMLHQAATPGSFARLGELYLRRHLINRLARNQASNLYGRVRDLLAEDDFEPAAAADHFQLAGHPAEPWLGTDQQLLGVAWRLGHFEVVRYRDDAKKLSPVLETPDLRRFVVGLLAETGAALTLAHVVRALVMRFDLQSPGTTPLEDVVELVPGSTDVVEEVSATRAARVVLAELSARQVAILRCSLDDMTVRETAAEVAASVGTVSAEQRSIAAVLAQISDEQGASRGRLLNALRDSLFKD
jgi:hypothetical protein